MSNAIPNVHDAAVISNLLSSCEMEAVAIRTQLQTLQDRLRNVERWCKRYGSILSVIRRLPSEILGEIFQHLGSQDSLTQICRVCKTWRDAAYLTPRLWQHTTVDLEHEGAPVSLTYEAVIAWMSRAKMLPKTLRLQSLQCPDICRCHCAVEDGEDCRFAQPFVGKILKDGIPLEHVSVRCPTQACLENFAAYIQPFRDQPSPWNSIDSFSMRAEWDTVPSATFAFLPLSIRSLTLDLPQYVRGSDRPWKAIPSNILEKLTHLSLTCGWHASRALKTLQHCSNLESLTLCLWG